MLRAPPMISRVTPEETACFISENGQVVLLASVMPFPPRSYALAGRVLTIYDESNLPNRQRYAIGARALAVLRMGAELVIAEIDEEGPVHTTLRVRQQVNQES